MGIAAMAEREATDALASAPDAELVLRAREDPSGPPFETLYERHRGDVFRYLLGIVSERELAEDLVQDTFLRIYEHLGRFDATRAFRPWLYHIARNVALNALRSRRLKEKAGGELPERAASDRIAVQVETGDAVAKARAALAALEDEERALLVERVGLGMKMGELAESLGVTERTVRNRLDAAIDRLTRAFLGKSGGPGAEPTDKKGGA